MQQQWMDSALEGVCLQGRYRVDERVTQGGMAWIYKATDLNVQRTVAAKILFASWMEDEDVFGRFKREVEIHQQLHHPNIVRVDAAIQENGIAGMVMEWVEHGDLKQLLEQRQGPLSFQEIEEIFLPMVRAIVYAHRQGVIHRDLKPGNVLLTRKNGRWVPKITDFGIAKLLENPGNTMTGAKLGTPQYMAPEQWQDSKQVDHRADIYSLGVILYRMLTGKLLFSGTYEQMIFKLLEEEAPYPEGVPDPLAGVVLQALAKEPQDRYASCEIFLKILEQFLPLFTSEDDPILSDTDEVLPSGSGTLAYIPSFAMQPTQQSSQMLTGEADTLDAVHIDEQPTDEIIPDSVIDIPLPPGGLVPRASSTPRVGVVDDLGQTSVWESVDEDADFNFDEAYQKALELAASVKQKEQNAQLKTIALDDDDPEMQRLQMILESQSGLSAVGHGDKGSSKLGWIVVLVGLLLVALSVGVGWFIGG